MGTEIFLGEPPADIKEEIIKRFNNTIYKV